MCSTHLLLGLLLHTDKRRLECLLSSHRRLLQMASDMAEGLENIEDTEAGEIIGCSSGRVISFQVWLYSHQWRLNIRYCLNESTWPR